MLVYPASDMSRGFGYIALALDILFRRLGKHFLCRNAAFGKMREDCTARRVVCKRVLHLKGTYADPVSRVFVFL